MSALRTRVKYTGAIPGADTNTYVLYDSSVRVGDAKSIVNRVSLVLLTTQAGTLRAQWREQGGTVWKPFAADVAVAAQSASLPLGAGGGIAHDYGVSHVDDFRLLWVHGGVAIGAGSFIVIVHQHMDRAVMT